MEKTRDEAWALLTEHTKSESLLKHALAVEACVKAYGAKLGGDPELWGMAGLLHDFDYERWPEPPEHATKGSEILAAKGYPRELIDAILSHAEWSGVPRDTPLRKALFACDELAGFLTAVALVRPSKKIADVEVSSVKKKMKDKAFARPVKREDIVAGAELLGVPLDEHIATCLAAMKSAAPSLGL
ncbi:MAG: HDIG domain-containing protein [Planctomycetes bacterium]|nr:HDIG domain-containing protein [Planctomycetota bacterium]